MAIQIKFRNEKYTPFTVSDLIKTGNTAFINDSGYLYVIGNNSVFGINTGRVYENNDYFLVKCFCDVSIILDEVVL